jgi:hypothetical protein
MQSSIVISNSNAHIQEQRLHRPVTSSGKVMMKTKAILQFAQRAWWIYMAEAVIVVAIGIAIAIAVHT